MSGNERPTLLVLGAGPKAIAIAAKNWVLRQAGYATPELVIVEKQDLTAHWSGANGFTDGKRILGTPPHKDVGFPYASTGWGKSAANKQVDQAMAALSWNSYLIDEYRYSEWVDRGRPGPTHGEWSKYLQWVADRVELPLKRAEVIGIGSQGGRWHLQCRAASPAETPADLVGDGLVITGPGVPIRVAGQPVTHPRIFDGASFWNNLDVFEALPRKPADQPALRVGVVGTGETAAAIVVTLAEILRDKALIEVITSRGVLYSRDEGFQENHVFSDPDALWTDKAKESNRKMRDSRLTHCHTQHFKWSDLTEADRREFVARTDRGVFSIQAMQSVNLADNVSPVTGTAKHLQMADDGGTLVEIDYHGQTRQAHYDYVVVAIGFNPLWFTSLLAEETHAALRTAGGGELVQSALERQIGHDLTVQNFGPRLHLPMLAGVAQGPGFPNLSCLGLLSDRVLSAYVPGAW